MTTELKLYYPRGCGGSWLANLIWHLENNDLTHPKVKVVYDYQPKTQSFKFNHAFEVVDRSTGERTYSYNKKSQNSVLFSTKYFFNMYINDAYKVRYGILNLGKELLMDQLFTLSDSFRYIWTDSDWYNYYCGDNDLEYCDVFQNPDRFVDCLFQLLIDKNIKFTNDADYVRASIQHYRSTCVDPETVFGNMDNLVWLASCHAVSMLKEIPLPITITDKTTFSEIQTTMAEFNDMTQQFVYPMMFKWK